MKNYALYEHPNITSLTQLVSIQGECIPNSIAFQYMSKKQLTTVTYKQFHDDVISLATYFYNKGIHSVKIALLGENSYAWIRSYFAVVCSGNIIVPMDKELSDEEISSLLFRCGAAILLHSASYTDTAEKMLQGGAVSRIICMDDYSSLTESGFDMLEVDADESDVCSIIFTSGTTGTPKGVMLSQRSLIVDAVDSCRNVFIAGSSLLTLPLHHTFAFTTSVLAMLVYGVPIYISKSLRTFNADMKQFKPQNMFVVPLYVETMYKNIWRTVREKNREKKFKLLIKVCGILRKCGIDIRRKAFRSVHEQFGGNLTLVVCGGAFLDQKYIDFMDDIGLQVLNGYGITECSPVVAVNRNRYARKNSVGLPLACCDVRIIDGEICVKGPNVMLGYYQDEEATKEAMHEGWFKTGDLGYQDDDGFLYVTGRKKNLIILSNGENVSAEELEMLLQRIGGVEEVIVCSEDNLLTAEIYAENTAGIQDEITLLNKTLPAYKRIQSVKFRDTAFEKTTTKKIKRA